MPSQQDLHIYVTGIVGRAMGSGKYTPEDILMLTQSAYDAFHAIFGKPESSGPPASVGAAKHVSEAVGQFVASVSGGGVQPESKPFDMWGGDRAYLGWKDNKMDGVPEPEVAWGVWAMHFREGNERAKKVLEQAANADPKKGDPKWHQANERRIARAKAVLAMK